MNYEDNGVEPGEDDPLGCEDRQRKYYDADGLISYQDRRHNKSVYGIGLTRECTEQNTCGWAQPLWWVVGESEERADPNDDLARAYQEGWIINRWKDVSSIAALYGWSLSYCKQQLRKKSWIVKTDEYAATLPNSVQPDLESIRNHNRLINRRKESWRSNFIRWQINPSSGSARS